MSYFHPDVLGTSVIAALGTLPTLLSVAMYVLTALGLYTMASRRGIRKPWLAWIPVVNVWILGSLSDQYRYVVRGEVRSKRKWLLGLGIAAAVLEAVLLVMICSLLVNAVIGAMGNVYDNDYLEMVLEHAMSMVLLAVPLLGVGIAKLVLYYMALYDVYTSCDPQNNVLFLVLSIFFGITRPFFLFFNREKDLGMPPRRQTPPPQPDPETWSNRPDYL